MTSTVTLPARPSRRGEPVWELLDLFPGQGEWSEAEYLRLSTNRLVEFNDGCLEVLPMPDIVHQLLAFFLCQQLLELSVGGATGLAAPAPFKLKIPNGRWREPDVSYLLPYHLDRYRPDWWDYADLVVEVVSPDDPNRDYVTKRHDYASAGVPEYWIVDPAEERITLLSLDSGTYREVGQVRPGEIANSLVVPGFAADFAALLAKARRRTPGNPTT